MKEASMSEDLYNSAKTVHTSLDRRLRMLLKKPYLTDKEELEIKELKKRKLFYKDIMERVREETGA
jgi:hypothetical protein